MSLFVYWASQTQYNTELKLTTSLKILKLCLAQIYTAVFFAQIFFKFWFFLTSLSQFFKKGKSYQMSNCLKVNQ